MAFPVTAPANNDEHHEKGEDFLADAGDWLRKPDAVYTDKYKMGAGGMYWGRLGLSHPVHHMLRLRGVVKFSDDANVALNLYDASTQPLNMGSAYSYGQNEWGSGGIAQANWQSWRHFGTDRGITLNSSRSSAYLKGGYFYEIECDVYRVSATETAVRSRMYYYGSGNAAQYAMVLVWFPHPITDITAVGLRTDSSKVIPKMRFHVEYW